VNELHLPWLQLSILISLLGAICVARLHRPESARRWTVIVCSLATASATGAWLDFLMLGSPEATDRFDFALYLTGRKFSCIDEFSAPLLPLVALLHLLTTMATLGAKLRRLSFAWILVAEATRLAMLSSREPWLIVSLLAAETIFPLLELRVRNRSARVFALHMACFVALMALGQTLLSSGGNRTGLANWAVVLLLAAAFIRSGMAPAHCWVTELFEHAGFGAALLFVTPLMGAYAAARLVLPVAPDAFLHGAGLIPLATSAYAAGLALVQQDSRRFFCFMFLSHSALVHVGLLSVSPIGLTGALCAWLSVGMALGGFGLSLRALEARHRRLSLTTFHGLYEHTPMLAACFLLTGMAGVGFPGTFGFLSNELLVDGAMKTYPYVGIAVVLVGALNGIAIVRAYFLLFTGTRHTSTVPLRLGKRERFALLTLATLIVLGGLFPQAGVISRHHAAVDMLDKRAWQHDEEN
jgi:NADH-quinone oxidoreductase subunit M